MTNNFEAPKGYDEVQEGVRYSEIQVIEYPTTNTMIQENRRTTMVRRAVATSESVLRIPHLAKIEVKPANRADRTAIKSHVMKVTS